ncbi:MAG: HBL/NHE enterotoxin family protein [Candidatus Rickettsiella isopodorum]
MNKKLSSAEKKDMYKQIDHLSKENLYLLAENDPIINEEETKEQISNVLGLNSDMQNYTNSLEAQQNISLAGEGVPDISADQKTARENARRWRTEINPKIAISYTDLKSFLNFVGILNENEIETIVDEALTSDSGKDNLNALIQEFSIDAGKNNESSIKVSNVLADYNTLLNKDFSNFLTSYEIIEAIFNDTDGKRAQLRRLLDEYLSIIQRCNVGIGIASAAIVLSVLTSILAAILSVISAGTTATIIGGAVAISTAAVGSLPELIKQRDEYQAKYRSTNSELAHLNTQCALVTAIKNNLTSMANYNGKITPQIGYLARTWQTIGNNYAKIKESTDAGLNSNKAIIMKTRLKAAYRTALSLEPIAKQCELNQLLPVKVDRSLVIDLHLPSVWTNKAIDSDTFFDYLRIRRKN